MNTPGQNANAVAELVFGMMIAAQLSPGARVGDCAVRRGLGLGGSEGPRHCKSLTWGNGSCVKPTLFTKNNSGFPENTV